MPFDGTDWQPEPEPPLWLLVRLIADAEKVYPRQLTDEEARRLDEARIDYSDIPPLDEEFFSTAKPPAKPWPTTTRNRQSAAKKCSDGAGMFVPPLRIAGSKGFRHQAAASKRFTMPTFARAKRTANQQAKPDPDADQP